MDGCSGAPAVACTGTCDLAPACFLGTLLPGVGQPRRALSVASTLRFLTTSPPTLLLQKHIAHRSRIVTIVFPSDFGPSIPKFLRIVVHTIAKMTQTEEEYDEAQAGDESMTGPGAPTPLAALEASFHGQCTLPGALF